MSGKSEGLCYNCGGTGHRARDCTAPRAEGEARDKINEERKSYRRCYNCGKTGHIAGDCPQPANQKVCYNCGKDGHIAKECPDKKA